MSSSDEREFTVEAIVDRRVLKGRIQYLVKWEGYSAASNTWEDEDACDNCQDVIARFHEELHRRQEAEKAPREEHFRPTAIVGHTKDNGAIYFELRGSDGKNRIISLQYAKKHCITLLLDYLESRTAFPLVEDNF
jgi:hypothetical protein